MSLDEGLGNRGPKAKDSVVHAPSPIHATAFWIGIVATGVFVVFFSAFVGVLALVSAPDYLLTANFFLLHLAPIALWTIALVIGIRNTKSAKKLWLASIPLALVGAVAVSFFFVVPHLQPLGVG